MTGKELADARMETGLSQEDFAKLISISRAYLAKNEAARDVDIPHQLEFKAKKAIENTRLSIPSLKGLAELRKPLVGEPPPTYHKAGASEGHPPLPNAHLGKIMADLAARFKQSDKFEMIEVEGSSMEPTVHSGDLLLCRAISVDDIGNGHDGDPSARVYVIFTNRADLAKERPSGKWVKRITNNKHTNRFTCRSDNIDSIEAFHTFQIARKEILSAWYPVLRLTWNLSNPHRDLYSRLDELESRIEMLEEDNQ